MKAVNLIPVEQREGASVGVGRSEGAAYAVMGLLAGLAIMAVIYGMAKRDVESNTSQVSSLSSQAQAAQSQAAQLVPYTSFVAMRQEREQAVTTLVASRFDWAHAMHELGRVVPPSVSISSLTGSVGAATAKAGAATAVTAPTSAAASAGATSSVTSATPPGAVPGFTLSGCATTQRVVALFLERLRLMDGVSQVTLQNSTKTAGTGGSPGACGTGAPSFALSVVFEPLPTTAAETATATAPKAKTVASTTAAPKTAAPTTSTKASGSSQPATTTTSGSAVR
jgi:Tfp pilus assembly protein PilN